MPAEQVISADIGGAPPALLIAATAELNRHTVLHLDKDFELITDVTGQPVERTSLPQAALDR